MPSYRLLLARVRAAFFAAAERWALLRWRAAERACLESALFEAADRPSRPSAFLIARERLREGALRFAPFFSSRLALRRVSFEAAPFFGGGNRTPARRAFDKPIAIACLVDRAPCLPSRMCSISSRTNSPACVEGDLPSRASSRARSVVSCSGMTKRISLQGVGLVVRGVFRRKPSGLKIEKTRNLRPILDYLAKRHTLSLFDVGLARALNTLPQRLRQFLLDQPETTDDLHVVSVTLKDGRDRKSV